MRTQSRRAALALVLLLAATLGTPIAASAAPPQPGWYEIVNRYSVMCLEDVGGGTDYGTPTAQWRCHGGTNQQWYLQPYGSDPAFVTIRNGHSGTCLSAPFGTGTELTTIDLETCRNLQGQVWRLVPRTDGTFEPQYAASDGSTICLDVSNRSFADGVRAVTRRCSGGTSTTQAWSFRPSPPPDRSTPRIQMYTGTYLRGDKLDGDAPKTVTNMVELGRCVPFCMGNWNDLIQSVDTRGGGQTGAYVRVWIDVHMRGACLDIPVGTYIDSLSQVEVLRYSAFRYLPVGPDVPQRATYDWSNAISSFQVSRFRLPIAVCDYAVQDQRDWDPNRPPAPRP